MVMFGEVVWKTREMYCSLLESIFACTKEKGTRNGTRRGKAYFLHKILHVLSHPVLSFYGR